MEVATDDLVAGEWGPKCHSLVRVLITGLVIVRGLHHCWAISTIVTATTLFNNEPEHFSGQQ